MVGIFPRSSSWTSNDWPSVYTPAIAAVNQGLDGLAEKQHVYYVDCSHALLPRTQVAPHAHSIKWLLIHIS